MNMLPRKSSLHVVNAGPIHLKHRGDVFLPHDRRQSAYLPYVVIGQFASRVVAFFKPYAKCMLRIFRWREPFKVFDTDMQQVAVYMVNLLPTRWLGQKGVRDQAVNSMRFSTVFFAEMQGETGITRSIWGCPKDTAHCRSTTSTNALHPATTTDFIPAFVINDGSPFFRSGMMRTHRGFLLGVMRTAVTPARPPHCTVGRT